MNIKTTLLIVTATTAAACVGYTALCQYFNNKQQKRKEDFNAWLSEQKEENKIIRSKNMDYFLNLLDDIEQHMQARYETTKYKLINLPFNADMGNDTGYFDGLVDMDISGYVPADIATGVRPVFMGTDTSGRIFFALYDANENRNIVFFQRYLDKKDNWVRQCIGTTPISGSEQMIQSLCKNIAIA